MFASAWRDTVTRAVRLGGLGVLLSAPLPLRAQAPEITPAGDPSVRPDTIYALAVDSTKYREEPYVWLLDDGVVRAEANGTSATTYRQIIQILQPAAVENWAERRLSYEVGREEVTLNWARVLDLKGKVISEKPVHVQTLDAPVPEQSPVYTKRKIIRLSLGGVAPGTIIDLSYTQRTKTPVLRGNFAATWTITSGSTVRRSRYIVDLPEGAPFHLRERALDFKPVVQHVKGRVVRTWSKSDIARIEPEVFPADSNDVIQTVGVSGPIGWGDISRWYAGLSRDRLAADPALDARLAEVTRDARTRLDSLRAAYRWVAQDIRYVSLSLGLGGYQPRPPAEVVRTGVGDCKDKATLFVVLARRLGFEAYPVLVASGGKPVWELPSIGQFDHLIAAVKLDGAWKFVDPTAELVPFEEPPVGEDDERGLLVRDNGTFEEISFPKLRPQDNRADLVVAGAVDEQGRFTGFLEQTMSGLLQYKLRNSFSAPLTEQQRRDLPDAIAGNVVEGAHGDSLVVFDGRDLRAPVRVRVHIAGDRALRRASQGWIFMLPLARYGNPETVGKLEAEKERRFPLDVGEVVGPIERTDVLRLTIPAGWVADLPPGVKAASAFGAYEASYEQKGREVTVRRWMRGAQGVLPQSAKGELIGWMNKVGEDDATFLLLHPGAAPAASLKAAPAR